MIRLIALDLDGTLLGPDRRVSAADGEAIAEARERGVHIVLNTARWYALVDYTARRLELQAPMICHNGVHIKEPNDGPELLHRTIPQEIAREIAAFCDAASFETCTTVDGVTAMRMPSETAIDPARLPPSMRLSEAHAAFVTAPATGIMVFNDHAIRRVLDEFEERYKDVLAFPIGLSESFQQYLTITAADADKGNALRLVCDHLRVAPEEAMAVGDAASDVAMFALGVGVAMGNATDGVKAEADAVAPSNADAGVAWAIRRFVLEGS